jgi:hypothetical protein
MKVLDSAKRLSIRGMFVFLLLTLTTIAQAQWKPLWERKATPWDIRHSLFFRMNSGSHRR